VSMFRVCICVNKRRRGCSQVPQRVSWMRMLMG
jgi:hypothetical protein